MIAALRTEISEAQDINRSLRKDNQALIQENENIRFDHGVESRREFDELRIEISRLHSQIDDLNKQVDQSCVAAVREAYDELERSRRKADRQLDSYQAFVAKKLRSILDERNQSIAALNHKIKARAGSLWLARDLLFVYALCSLAADPIILLDLRDIFVSIGLLLEKYYGWIYYPYYIPYPGGAPLPYEARTAWAVRIISVIGGLALVVAIVWLCGHVYGLIRAQWCRLAVRITVSLLIIVSVLGSIVKEIFRWNTAVLFFILFNTSMMLMHRLGSFFACSDKAKEWEYIKNHNDKSFFITYHIYQSFTLIGKEKN